MNNQLKSINESNLSEKEQNTEKENDSDYDDDDTESVKSLKLTCTYFDVGYEINENYNWEKVERKQQQKYLSLFSRDNVTLMELSSQEQSEIDIYDNMISSPLTAASSKNFLDQEHNDSAITSSSERLTNQIDEEANKISINSNTNDHESLLDRSRTSTPIDNEPSENGSKEKSSDNSRSNEEGHQLSNETNSSQNRRDTDVGTAISTRTYITPNNSQLDIKGGIVKVEEPLSLINCDFDELQSVIAQNRIQEDAIIKNLRTLLMRAENEKKDIVQGMKKEIHNLEKDVQDKSEEIEKLQRSNLQCDENLKKLQEQIKSLSSQLAAEKKKNSLLKEDNQKLENEEKLYLKQKQSHESELHSLRNELNQYQELFSQFDNFKNKLKMKKPNAEVPDEILPSVTHENEAGPSATLEPSSPNLTSHSTCSIKSIENQSNKRTVQIDNNRDNYTRYTSHNGKYRNYDHNFKTNKYPYNRYGLKNNVSYSGKQNQVVLRNNRNSNRHIHMRSRSRSRSYNRSVSPTHSSRNNSKEYNESRDHRY